MTIKRPTISVVIPVYNAEKTIKDCIYSILSQNVPDMEIIAVNDGSLDSSGDICDEISKQDNRVLVIHQENKGGINARMTGVEYATGEWITFVDNDDTLIANRLHLLLDAQNNNTDIIVGNGIALGKTHKEIIPMQEFRHLAVAAEGTIGKPWGSIYRRKILNREILDMPRHLWNGEDYIFWLRLVFSNNKDVTIIPENIYCKGKDTTGATFIWTIGHASAIDEMRRSIIPKEMHHIYRKAMIKDALVNLCSVALQQPDSAWRKSEFTILTLKEAKQYKVSISYKTKLFLSIRHKIVRQWLLKLSKIFKTKN